MGIGAVRSTINEGANSQITFKKKKKKKKGPPSLPMKKKKKKKNRRLKKIRHRRRAPNPESAIRAGGALRVSGSIPEERGKRSSGGRETPLGTEKDTDKLNAPYQTPTYVQASPESIEKKKGH